MNNQLPIWLSMNIRVCGRLMYIHNFQGVSPDVEVKQLEWNSLLRHEQLEITRRLKSLVASLETMQVAEEG